jgi:hypothetical protein
MKIWKELSETLRITSLLAILLIVAIHYHSQPFMGTYSGNYLVQEVIHNIIGRAAVPIFSLMSGFLFFQGSTFTLSTLAKKLKNRTATILLPTLFISLLIWLWDQFPTLVLANQPYQGHWKQFFVVWWLYPNGSQFWFVRDLMILFFLTPYIYLLVQRFSALVPALLLFFWCMDWQLFPIWEGRYFLNNDTLTFFVIGAWVSLRGTEDKVQHFLNPSRNTLFQLFVIYMLLAGARIYLEPSMSLWYQTVYHWYSLPLQKAVILIGMYLLLICAQGLCRTRIKGIFLRLAGYSFFIFLVHDYPLKNILWEWLYQQGISLVWIFYLRLGIALALLFLVAAVLETAFPQFFTWLNGGRNRQHQPVEKPVSLEFSPNDQPAELK